MSDSLLWHTANPLYMTHFSGNALPKPAMPDSIYNYLFPGRKFRENMHDCIAMQIPIVAGTDAGNYAVFFGYSLHNELQQYVKAGMSTSQALCAATENLGAVLSDIRIGKIKVG